MFPESPGQLAHLFLKDHRITGRPLNEPRNSNAGGSLQLAVKGSVAVSALGYGMSYVRIKMFMAQESCN